MKILIADDQTRRYDRLVEALEKIGVNREQIDIVNCAHTAQECLEKNYYDLFILDVLLPVRPEDEPDLRHSIDLLIELHEDDLLIKPGYILGITADKVIVGEASKIFDELTWTIVQYAHDNDGWINQVLNCIRYLLNKGSRKEEGSLEYQVDLAVICALEKPELEEVLRLPWNWSSARPLDDIVFVHDGYFEVEGRKISVCATFAPRMGMVSTALRSAAIISLLRPRMLAMCGICAGVKGKVNIGDVILADPAWDFQSGKRVRDKGNAQFSIAPHHLYPPTVVRTHVEQIRSDKEALREIFDRFQGDPPSNMPQIVIGPLASGSAVLADGEVVKEIQTQHRELRGVEMEAYGMFAAANVASHPQPKSFALKAVCDFADPDKDDSNQRYAAFMSANVLQLLMERFGSRLLD
jgi:nucleoside phosphorylase/CheY-like chemotaxis protein